jgi:hypothetical protein
VRSAPQAALLTRLDSMLINPSDRLDVPEIGNLIAARLYHEQGLLPQALAAIRRRPFNIWPSPIYATYDLEEGRLAALNGDREGAPGPTGGTSGFAPTRSPGCSRRSRRSAPSSRRSSARVGIGQSSV